VLEEASFRQRSRVVCARNTSLFPAPQSASAATGMTYFLPSGCIGVTTGDVVGSGGLRTAIVMAHRQRHA